MEWSNSRLKYKLVEQELKVSPAEKDLGMVVGIRLSVRQQRVP